MYQVNDKVKIKGFDLTGIILKSEIKRIPYINNGKQIRYYTVKMTDNSIAEFEATEMVKI